MEISELLEIKLIQVAVKSNSKILPNERNFSIKISLNKRNCSLEIVKQVRQLKYVASRVATTVSALSV